MNRNEKILAEFQEKITPNTNVLVAFRAINILEQILATLPPNEDISLRMWEEFETEVVTTKGLTWSDFPNWLKDKP